MSANPFKELNKIKGSLPFIEDLAPVPAKYIFNKGAPLVVGSIIVRPTLGYTSGRLEPQYVKFTKTPKGTYMFRAHRPYRNEFARSMSSHTQHWLVGKPTLAGGMVCFSANKVPENWTHFVVTAVSKKGHTLFVEPVVGNLREMYNYPKLLSLNTKIISREVLENMVNVSR